MENPSGRTVFNWRHPAGSNYSVYSGILSQILYMWGRQQVGVNSSLCELLSFQLRNISVRISDDSSSGLILFHSSQVYLSLFCSTKSVLNISYVKDILFRKKICVSFTEICATPDCCQVHKIPFCSVGEVKLLENVGAEDEFFSFCLLMQRPDWTSIRGDSLNWKLLNVRGSNQGTYHICLSCLYDFTLMSVCFHDGGTVVCQTELWSCLKHTKLDSMQRILYLSLFAIFTLLYIRLSCSSFYDFYYSWVHAESDHGQLWGAL